MNWLNALTPLIALRLQQWRRMGLQGPFLSFWIADFCRNSERVTSANVFDAAGLKTIVQKGATARVLASVQCL